MLEESRAGPPERPFLILEPQRLSLVLQQPRRKQAKEEMRERPGRPACGTHTYRGPTYTGVTLPASCCPFHPRPCQQELDDCLTSAGPAFSVPLRLTTDTCPSQALLVPPFEDGGTQKTMWLRPPAERPQPPLGTCCRQASPSPAYGQGPFPKSFSLVPVFERTVFMCLFYVKPRR